MCDKFINKKCGIYYYVFKIIIKKKKKKEGFCSIKGGVKRSGNSRYNQLTWSTDSLFFLSTVEIVSELSEGKVFIGNGIGIGIGVGTGTNPSSSAV